MGQNVIMSDYHTSNKPGSTGQLESRSRLGMLNSFLTDISWLVNPGFARYAKKKSALNAAFSFNYPNAFVVENNVLQINYPAIVFSRGDIVSASGPETFRQTNSVLFTWLAQPQSVYCQFTDKASFLICNSSKHQVVIADRAVDRHLLTYTLDLPEDFEGDTLHCYLSFSSADGKLPGNSGYAGILNGVAT